MGSRAKVNKLEWNDEPATELLADTIVGQFFINAASELRFNYPGGGSMYQTLLGTFGDWDEARAAAQAHFDALIRSALAGGA